jgi:transcription elongation GreA/GreB family factor
MKTLVARKQALLDELALELQRELAVLVAAAKFTHAAATHEDSKPENDKDTRGLELAYLAGGQAERARELEGALARLQQVKASTLASTAPAQAGALVHVDQGAGETEYFLLPVGGGKTLGKSAGQGVLVLTPTSPLGAAILGLRSGDETELTARGKTFTVRVGQVA